MTDNQSSLNNKCFVIMPISDQDNYETGHFQKVYESICPAIETSGYTPHRADDNKGTTIIHFDILHDLIEAPMAVCDLSSRNPNVLFELGIRQAFDMPVVLIQDEKTPPTFDLSILRYHEYSSYMKYHEVLHFQQVLSVAINNTKKNAIEGNRNTNSIMKLLNIIPAKLPTLNKEHKKFDNDYYISKIKNASMKKYYDPRDAKKGFSAIYEELDMGVKNSRSAAEVNQFNELLTLYEKALNNAEVEIPF